MQHVCDIMQYIFTVLWMNCGFYLLQCSIKLEVHFFLAQTHSQLSSGEIWGDIHMTTPLLISYSSHFKWEIFQSIRLSCSQIKIRAPTMLTDSYADVKNVMCELLQTDCSNVIILFLSGIYFPPWVAAHVTHT